ncbi:cytochrome c oxidase subunit 3 [Paracoccus benzoatiresistens]|uniref:Cytochrome c oxidase subunit 3 n=1 Tax=Paracoccus benzoatiresistens TaxID=2997341 RepID=A0ABT4J8L4_9RHOB|nr:cytochrome c oxidase subunit 3 [Paracoccus sp. EF6]MCZ0963471.1 cytochrome c oxidase subunit 3 [Paracoccus sp. EF6]
MSIVLAFVVPVIAVAFWWLIRQGVMSKPWLETGLPEAVPVRSAEHVGLGIFLAVVGCLFALFGSAFVMRMDVGTWSSLRLPPIVWANTAQLVLASLFLHLAFVSAKRGDRAGPRRDMTIAALATVGFLLGQLLAWRELTMEGGGLTTSPAASFFYLLSGLHALHILGGLAALGLVMSRGGADGGRLRLGIGLCVAYWDFLLVVWLGLLVLFLGWANRFVEICRGVLT